MGQKGEWGEALCCCLLWGKKGPDFFFFFFNALAASNLTGHFHPKLLCLSLQNTITACLP